MTTDHLKAAMAAQPLTPLVTKTTGGREYRVDHPELVSFSPGGRVINLWTSLDAGVWIDVLMIESVHRDEKRPNHRRKSA